MHRDGALVQQEDTTRTALLAAMVPLLALTGLAMTDNISALTVGTVQDLDDHDATQLHCGHGAAKPCEEDSTSTLCAIFRVKTYLLDLLPGVGVGLHSDEEGRWMRERA